MTAVQDYKIRMIYNRYPAAVFLLALFQICIQPGVPDLQDRILGACVVSVPMLFLAVCVPGAFGGGDIKLMCASGFLIGTTKIICAFSLAILIAGMYIIVMLMRKKINKKERIAFGPFLAIGLVIALFYGDEIISFCFL